MNDLQPKLPGPKLPSDFDPSRWAYAVFFIFFLMGAWVLSHVIEDTWHILWSYWPRIGRPQQIIVIASGVILAFLGLVIALRKKQWLRFVREVAVELSQVVWPTRSETRAATVVVVVLTLICSAIFKAMDFACKFLTDQFYGI